MPAKNETASVSKEIWVFCEQRDDQIMPISYQLLSEAKRLAADLDAKVCGIVLGSGLPEKELKILGGYGADKVLYCDNELLKVYTTDAYAKVICDLATERNPEIFLIGATNIGRDLGPRCAARLHTGLTADCTHLDINVEKYKEFLRGASNLDVDNMTFDETDDLKMTRPAFGGHLMATIICPRFRPQMSTVRPGVMKMQEFDEKGQESVAIEQIKTSLSAADINVDVKEIVKEIKQIQDISDAKVIVSVGRGISKDVEGGLKLASELAAVLGGAVGSSRACVDAGWTDASQQVGQTGKTVRPRIYIALGISGAIQHLAGMSNSECIVAVNKNENAPIFENATYGIVGDLFKVVPALISEFKSQAQNS